MIEDIAKLSEAVGRDSESWFLLHNVHTDRWVAEKAPGVMKDVVGGGYDDWKGPFDLIETVRGKKETLNARQPTSVPIVQDALLADKIRKVRQQHGIGI